MFDKGTRYINTNLFSNLDGEVVFKGIRPRTISITEGVLEHVVDENDRLDLLALKYYNNSRLWWKILDANPEILYAGDLSLSESVGMTMVIPQSKNPRGR